MSSVNTKITWLEVVRPSVYAPGVRDPILGQGNDVQARLTEQGLEEVS